MTRISIQFTPPADLSEASKEDLAYSSEYPDDNRFLVRKYPDKSKIEIMFQEYIRYSEIYSDGKSSIDELITRSVKRVSESVKHDISDYGISIIFDQDICTELSDSIIMSIEKSENELASEYNSELLSTGEVLIDFTLPTKSLA